MMEFKEMLNRAKESDKKAILRIVEMYRPLLIKNSMVDGRFDEDLYQEQVCTVLSCIRKFEAVR